MTHTLPARSHRAEYSGRNEHGLCEYYHSDDDLETERESGRWEADEGRKREGEKKSKEVKVQEVRK